MSFTLIENAPARLNRSELAVPGSQPQFFDKAAKGTADVVFLDLEDAVAPDEKEKARRNIVQALNQIDWRGRTMSLRINGLETALGMQNMNQIAAASRRLESLHFGVADYAASTRARTINIGGANPDYAILTDKDEQGRRETHWGDMWHYALARMVVAARANGLRPIDGPFGDFKDEDGYRAAARRAAVLGCEGKWAIHPSQVALANDTFTPSEKEVERARRILAAMEQAKREGKGAVALDGRLLDIASIRQAEVLVKKAEQIPRG